MRRGHGFTLLPEGEGLGMRAKQTVVPLRLLRQSVGKPL